MTKVKPLVLCILDGWGYRAEAQYNAIAAANTPNWDHFWNIASRTFIKTSGMAVGLPEGQMGNSEVGHMNIGAGRVVYQELTRITQAIKTGEMLENPVLNEAINKAIQHDKSVHILGLLSPGGVHSHEDHIFAMIEMAAKKGAKKIYLHALLDGRDTPPRSAKESLEKAEAVFKKIGVGKIATLIGRYYAMDRDKRWDRVEIAYDLLTQGIGVQANSAVEGLEAAYAQDQNDEFVHATVIGDKAPIVDGDSVIFMNFRSDRAREITYPFTETSFDGFPRKVFPKVNFVCLTQYQDSIHAPIAFGPTDLVNSFGEVVADAGLKQLRIAETEKYPHVTFFFNGGRETLFTNEERILVPSPKVATYDLQPEMSSVEVADRLIDAIENGNFDVIICNFANPDMVGHTGVFPAIVKAVEAVDTAIGRVYKSVKKMGGEMLITADHGNAELTFDDSTNQPHTAHTTGDVPLLYLGRKATLESGALCDLAPTMLGLLGLKVPKQMTGKNLIKFN